MYDERQSDKLEILHFIKLAYIVHLTSYFEGFVLSQLVYNHILQETCLPVDLVGDGLA